MLAELRPHAAGGAAGRENASQSRNETPLHIHPVIKGNSNKINSKRWQGWENLAPMCVAGRKVSSNGAAAVERA